MAGWGGALSQRARAVVGATLPAPCSQCGRPVLAEQAWEVDHVVPRHERPDLMADPGNWAPAHRRCNRRGGQAITTAKRMAARRQRTRPAATATSRPW